MKVQKVGWVLIVHPGMMQFEKRIDATLLDGLVLVELILYCASVGDDVFNHYIISLRFKGRSLVELVVSVAPILVSCSILGCTINTQPTF